MQKCLLDSTVHTDDTENWCCAHTKIPMDSLHVHTHTHTYSHKRSKRTYTHIQLCRGTHTHFCCTIFPNLQNEKKRSKRSKRRRKKDFIPKLFSGEKFLNLIEKWAFLLNFKSFYRMPKAIVILEEYQKNKQKSFSTVWVYRKRKIAWWIFFSATKSARNLIEW